MFFTSLLHCVRTVKAPRTGVPPVARVISALAHCTNLPCFFAGVEPSKSAHGHARAIAPRTPAMAFASLSADAPAPQASVFAPAAPASPATASAAATAMNRRGTWGDLGMVLSFFFVTMWGDSYARWHGRGPIQEPGAIETSEI